MSESAVVRDRSSVLFPVVVRVEASSDHPPDTL